MSRSTKVNWRPYLRAAYAVEGVTSSEEKARVRSALYRLDPDWDVARLPSLAVAFAVLSLTRQDRFPGWIPMYQDMACSLADAIDRLLKENET